MTRMTRQAEFDNACCMFCTRNRKRLMSLGRFSLKGKKKKKSRISKRVDKNVMTGLIRYECR